MINKNIIFGGIIVAVGIAFYTINSSEEVEKKIVIEKEIVHKEIEPEKKKSIEILYLDEEKKVTLSNEKGKTKSNEKHNENYNKNLNTNKNIEELDSEEIVKYIEKHNLVDVTPHKTNQTHEIPPRFSVYADISEEDAKEQYDNSLPPPAPSIATGTVANGSTYTKIVSGYVKAAAKTLIVTENDTNGEPISVSDLKIDDTVSQNETKDENEENNKVVFTGPPSIGQ